MRGLPDEKEALVELVTMPMPFGKYKGRLLLDLPEPYLVWFSQKGFPHGRLGELLALALEIKSNGLTRLLDPLRVDGSLLNKRSSGGEGARES